LEESKRFLLQVLTHFKEHELAIGQGLLEATKETRHVLSRVAACPVCKEGELIIRSGKFGMFVVCNKYPACKTTFSVPSGALVKPSDQVCKECSFPQVMTIRKGKRPWLYCLNKVCPAKLRWREEQVKKQVAEGVVITPPKVKKEKVVKPKRVRKKVTITE